MSGHHDSHESGAAAVEMAILMPVLILLLFGTMIFGLHLFRAQSMQAAAREGGRMAAVGADYTDIVSRVFDQQMVVDAPAELTVTVVREGTPVYTGKACRPVDSNKRVEVSASVKTPSNYALTIPFFGTLEPSFVTRANFRCEG